ncbi:DUF3604 domain-containing protein [Novosphingobium sp. TH158]|uniref:DUF3604 domain-containing protein n=1 Tax=Novosphingobium sp. TH158 TaxID=2067455 RepID=UPI00130456F3|nr:DUF3604 domain-containing protein [Novosphingobium sp. TH158]
MRKALVAAALAGLSALALSAGLTAGEPQKPVLTQSAAAPARADCAANPDRQAFFGDLHLHTALSFDAYTLMSSRVGPEDAYRFARGETILYYGDPVRRRVPFDFLAVTDHAENMGVFNQLEDPDSVLSQTEVGKMARLGGTENFFKAMALMARGATIGDNAPAVIRATWQRQVDAANAHYRPCTFTTFIGYEWTVNPDNQNLHRNVIFRGDSAPLPFTRFDSDKVEALWSWLATLRGQGVEALAIPHNANVSNGLMYNMLKSDGSPVDAEWGRLRQANEPLAEIVQNKGTSETHPLLSPNDEFAGFELSPWLLAGKPIRGKVPGSFWRDALGRGLEVERRTGVNPYKDGAVGAGDLHGGLSVSSEADYGGVGRGHMGGGKPSAEAMLRIFADAAKRDVQNTDVVASSAGLTGVWAEANTRDAIYAALRRKETFATSGTRIRVRLFAGDLPANLLANRDWVRRAYAQGVPMGADLQARSAPVFAYEALKDPDGQRLQRVQIVKVWIDDKGRHEQVYDAAVAPAGAVQFKGLWRDPSFRKGQAAVYYARVIELPSPRWTTLRAREYKLKLPEGLPETIQERAWTSPIWVR